MSLVEIGGSDGTAFQGSRSGNTHGMRMEGQDRGTNVEWTDEFLPAIRQQTDQMVQSARTPKWYTVRFVYLGQILVFRLLDYIKMPYHDFTYLQRVPRGHPVEHHWFPGYVFVEFDVECDRWQQLLRFPHVTEILGDKGLPTPLPQGIMEDLRGRLYTGLAKKVQAPVHSIYGVGTRVKIKDGPLKGSTGAVTWADKRSVKVAMMFFGQPKMDVEFAANDVIVV